MSNAMEKTSTNSFVEKNRPNYSDILHKPANSDKILNMTADTMFMLSKDGICVDMILHTSKWFLQNISKFIGKNIFELIPSETALALKSNFDKVLSTGETSTENYELVLSGKNYFFKCIIYKYDDDLILCQYRDITQRVLMKRKLETINQKLKEIEEVAQISQWNYNSDLKEFQYSGFSGALAVAGETKVISLENYLEYIHPRDRNNFEDFVQNGMQGNKADKLIVYRLLLNNKVFHFKFKKINTYYEDGMKMINGYVQNISDIMEKKHELEVVTLAVENSTDYIFSMKSDGQLVFGNGKYKDYNNLNVDEDITKYNFFDIISGSNKTKMMDIIHQLTSTNQTINFVELHPIPDKPEIIAFEYTSYLVQDSNGEDLIWIFGKDITEHVNYEKQVKELNQIMSTVLNNIPMSISVKDVKDDFKYIFSNRIGDEFHWGIKDGMIGKSDFEVFPEKIADKMRVEDLANFKSNHENRKIIEDVDEYGEKQIRDQLRILVKDETRPLLISIERDITKDKLMEQELIDAKEKAEQSDKLKSAFIANMSHEIRTPLNAIIGFSRIIAETENSDERQSYFSIVDENNTRLLGLINEILDISKIESGIVEFNYEPIDLEAFCLEILQTNSMRCGKNTKLIYDNSNQNLIINSDKNRLAQVYNNLIGNAIKFTKNGNINFGYIKKSDHIEFYVKDTGTGIETDQIDKVFERFVKTDNYSQGTGLGLSICKSILDKMGGTIAVDSTFGVGSCFTFTLPISCIVNHLANENNTSAPEYIERKEKKELVIVAEDTDSNYILLKAMIGGIYNLKRAKNGLEVVNMFEEHQPNLILMDIKMPVMNGLDATRVIRTISSDVPIIAFSAFAFEEDRNRSIESGCNDFLAKPFKKKQLVEMISKYLK